MSGRNPSFFLNKISDMRQQLLDSTDDATATEQLPQPDFEKVELMIMEDSKNDVGAVQELPKPDLEKRGPNIMADPKDDVSVVQELPQSYAEPKVDLCGPNVNAHSEAATVAELPQPDLEKLEPKIMADPKVYVSVVLELPQSYAEPIADTSGPDVVAHPEATAGTKQLPRPDLENLEPKIMVDPKDDVRVVQELPQSYEKPRVDVNTCHEAEVLVAAASASPTNNNLNLLENDEAVNVDSHEHERLYQRSLSTCSDSANDNGVFCGPSSDHCISELEMDNEDVTTVVFYPDHMAYRDRYCTDCVLTFTSSCIKIEGSTSDDDEETFRFQWGIEDLLYIKSHWYQLAGMAMLKIRVLMEDTIEAENVECPSGTELKFAFIGTNWYGKQETVTSLSDTYKTLWISMLESGDTVHGHTQASFPKYFPCFDQPFEEVIYPKGDIDAVSISKRDVDMLLPDTFVNDTIIDFYIKYLKIKIKPEDKQRFHFFNSFFFRKLADPDKEPLDACKGKEAFQRVRKWTKKVNLFEKDFVFIPVNYNYHWSLIVMCHLREVATYQDQDVTKLSKVPCVLHMDSIRGTHAGLKGLMQSYLKEEWKARLEETSEDICSRFDNMRFISLELPQQPNSFDCGLFLLHYVELFLEQAPISFNPFKITQSVDFLNVDWFPPADASLKRVIIQRLVYDLLEQPSHEAPSIAANDDNIHKGTAVNFFQETFNNNNNPSTVCQSPQDDEGIETSLLPSLSMTSEPCPVGPSEFSTPAFEPRSFLSMQFPSFSETTFDGYKSSLSPPLEENLESREQFVYSLTEIDLEQDNEIRPEIPYSSQNLGESWHQSNNFETSPQTSISGCEDSLEVINGSNQINQEVDFMEIRHEPKSPLMEHVEMLDGSGNGNGNAYNLTLSSHFSEIQANGPSGSGESSGLESDVQHPNKRMRTTEPSLEGGSNCS